MSERPDKGHTAEFTLYPDPDATGHFRTQGEILTDQMRKVGVTPVLEGARERLKGSELGIRLGTIRTLFEEGYGPKSRVGEAFEDGAIVASLITYRSANARLIPKIIEKIDSVVEGYEAQHYATATAPIMFSESRLAFIRSLRDEGTRGYGQFQSAIQPVAPIININKYNDRQCLAAVGQGIGFLLEQVRWAYAADYYDAADVYTDIEVLKEGDRQERFDMIADNLAKKALRHIASQTNRPA